ncbi:hypothetical protein N7468_000528 [Penicillium chermesinum]|uniref:VPS37 C-terminal domain-containing protein n=1 Tax=Penicillium chermesinum TaxID=63820 RepID=A0A9W9PKH8_9EURO|nr:uncharacterized protein N7468_000528 [Penicillium chermesinum]KAJ5249077.1 hypothetical protein N7468_000528 [Penicillium chermesinum]
MTPSQIPNHRPDSQTPSAYQTPLAPAHRPDRHHRPSKKAGFPRLLRTNRKNPSLVLHGTPANSPRTLDLQSILEKPSLISALASQHPSHTARQENLESLLQLNKDLATRLLEMQSRVEDLRASTESLLLTHQSLEVSWRKKQTEMDSALAPWSPKALYQRLSAAIAEQEAVCHAVEESFLDEDHHGRATEKETSDWVRRVRAEAAKLAARKEAKARWDEGRVGGWR